MSALRQTAASDGGCFGKAVNYPVKRARRRSTSRSTFSAMCSYVSATLEQDLPSLFPTLLVACLRLAAALDR